MILIAGFTLLDFNRLIVFPNSLYIYVCIDRVKWIIPQKTVLISAFSSCFPTGEENLLAILKRRWWKYMILGLIDIEANYLVIKAYQYTTLASVQVYQCVYESVFVKERKERFSNSQCPKKQKRSGLRLLLGLSDWRLNLGCLLHITLVF